jgi:hypothetical protein
VGDVPLSQALVGSWRLLSREDRTASGERRVDPALGEDPHALLVYDRGGNFAAQFMKRVRTPEEPGISRGAAANNSRAVNGYDAYFGTYTVNDSTATVTQTLVGALAPENVGLVVSRAMRVVGDELVIQLQTTSVDGAPVVRTLRWQRVA